MQKNLERCEKVSRNFVEILRSERSRLRSRSLPRVLSAACPGHSLFSPSTGLRLAPACSRLFPSSRLFCGPAMPGWSLVAVFFAFRLRPGLLLGRNGFSWFSDWNPKVQNCVNRVDLVKSFQTKVYYFLAKVGVDTAENEPCKVWSFG